MYVYIQCVEREIVEPQFFPTLELAHTEMLGDFKAMLEHDHVESIEEAYGKPLDRITNIDEDDCGLGETYAWANNCGLSHNNWDAKIYSINTPPV